MSAGRDAARLAFVAVLAFAQPDALGAQSFTVTAEVVEGCALVGSGQASGIDFGVLDFGTYPAVQTGPVTASVSAPGGGSVQLECTPGLELQVAVDGGQHLTGSQRRLGDGDGSFVPYSLFSTPGHDTPIPVTGNIPVTVPGTGFVDLPIYGLAVLPGTSAMPGGYGDSVQITLSW
ncbi:MAG: spore coat U domain-containing protein [Vicinamibacterales bacterium]